MYGKAAEWHSLLSSKGVTGNLQSFAEQIFVKRGIIPL